MPTILTPSFDRFNTVSNYKSYLKLYLVPQSNKLFDSDGATKREYDQSPAAHGAPSSAGAPGITGVNSKFGRSFIFTDGATDYIYYGDHADWYFAGDFYIGFWVRFSELNSGTWYGITSQYGTVGNRNFAIYHYTDGKIYFDLQSAAALSIQSAVDACAINIWYHFAILRSGNTFAAYIDGVRLGTGVCSGTGVNSGSPLGIGAAQDSSGNWHYMKGQIEQYVIFNGYTPYAAPTSFTVPTRRY